MYKKQVSLFKSDYMINDNGNEAENEKQISQTGNKQTQVQIWT